MGNDGPPLDQADAATPVIDGIDTIDMIDGVVVRLCRTAVDSWRDPALAGPADALR
jgi:hypothetical protein